MSITQDKKQALIKEYALSKQDTGSVEVQSAVLTERIINLTEHLQTNKKDHAARRGLLILVSRRRHLLNYIKNKAATRYEEIIKRLGIRK